MAQLRTTVPFWSKWDGTRLKLKQEEVGSREFDRGWRQKALSDDEALFRESFITPCISHTAVMATLLDPHFKEAYPRNTKFYMGVDLAIAASKSKGDYFVITTIACSKDSQSKSIVNIYRDRGLSFNQQLQKVIEYGEFFKPDLIVVENNAYQDALSQELKRVSDLR